MTIPSETFPGTTLPDYVHPLGSKVVIALPPHGRLHALIPS